MKKLAIVYGRHKGRLQETALSSLTATLLEYTMDYPACLTYEDGLDTNGLRCIYIGTKESNPYIRQHSPFNLTEPESYGILVENDTVLIEGCDDAGVLYGALDFYHKYVVEIEHPHNDNTYWRNPFEKETLPPFSYTSAPCVRERGLWTWGHVIYDYKGYLDNMMRLKMNRVIIWNDFAPVNARDIVEYAHDRGIRVIWGFSWLWDVNCNQFDLNALEGASEQILATYERQYANIGGDGIYFQTFTELSKEHIGGVLIAKAAAELVNRTAAMFYEKYPNLELQFGLHATSVKDRLEFIAQVDPRIRIVWENCGAFPFAYIPRQVEHFDETKAFVNKIAHLRGSDDRFGAVTKGLVKLDWLTFEHPTAPQCIGVSSRLVQEDRIVRKARIWRYIQAYWLSYAEKALEMVREMYLAKKGDLLLCALVEDGMFERNIMYPVALYAEMLWDCNADIGELQTRVALRSYVAFA